MAYIFLRLWADIAVDVVVIIVIHTKLFALLITVALGYT